MYILLVLTNALLGILTKNKKIILTYLIISYTLLWGLRYDVGIDYISYEKIFLENLVINEKGYLIINYILRKITDNFVFVTLIISFLTILPLSIYFCKINDIKRMKLEILLFLIITHSFGTANLMRQGIAVSFCYLASFYLEQKIVKKAILSYLIALSFHDSVLIFLFMQYIIRKLTINKIFSIYFLVIFYLGSLYLSYTKILIKGIELITNFIYKNYTVVKILNSNIEERKISFTIIIYLIIYIIIVKQQKSKQINYYSKMFYVSIIFRICSIENFLFNRIEIYFDLFLIPFLSTYYFINKSIKRKLTMGIVIFFLGVIYLRTGYFSSERSKNTYKTILYKSIDRKELK